MKPYFKAAIFTASALSLLAAGYSFGLLVQDRHDRRVAAAIRLEQAIDLHKAASVGSHEYALRDAKAGMATGEMHLNDGLDFRSLPFLLRESLGGQWDTGYHRAALARIVGFHRVHPETPFPADLRAELTAFAPQSESEQRGIDRYAEWDPAGY